MASRLPQIRLAVLCTVLLFAIIELGMAGAVTSTIGTYLEVSFSYSGLAIATSVITMATVPVMIALEMRVNFRLAKVACARAEWLVSGVGVDLGGSSRPRSAFRLASHFVGLASHFVGLAPPKKCKWLVHCLSSLSEGMQLNSGVYRN
ncbi:hypothetical protein FB451DRAFT_1376773, partial [Mycena latifolia]